MSSLIPGSRDLADRHQKEDCKVCSDQVLSGGNRANEIEARLPLVLRPTLFIAVLAERFEWRELFAASSAL